MTSILKKALHEVEEKLHLTNKGENKMTDINAQLGFNNIAAIAPLNSDGAIFIFNATVESVTKSGSVFFDKDAFSSVTDFDASTFMNDNQDAFKELFLTVCNLESFQNGTATSFQGVAEYSDCGTKWKLGIVDNN